MKRDPMAKGIYRRGEVYWFRPPMKKGVQPARMSLETTDLATAIKAAELVRTSPLLVTADPLMIELERFLATPYEGKKIYSRSSRDSMFYLLRAFIQWLPKGNTLAGINQHMVQSYYDLSLKTKNVHTAHKRLMGIRAFLNRAAQMKKIRVNPAIGVEEEDLPDAPRVLFCTAAQRDKLINECPREDLKLALMLGFHAGLRKQEIIQAVPFWFNMEQRFIDLRSTPTMIFNEHKRARVIPARGVLHDFLTQYGLRAPFMLRPDVKQGKSIYRYDFDLPMQNYVKAQGMEWVTAHVMRHTFASLLVIDNTSIFKVAKWLGDSVTTTEKHYAHLAPTDSDIEEGKRHAVKKP